MREERAAMRLFVCAWRKIPVLIRAVVGGLVSLALVRQEDDDTAAVP